MVCRRELSLGFKLELDDHRIVCGCRIYSKFCNKLYRGHSTTYSRDPTLPTFAPSVITFFKVQVLLWQVIYVRPESLRYKWATPSSFADRWEMEEGRMILMVLPNHFQHIEYSFGLNESTELITGHKARSTQVLYSYLWQSHKCRYPKTIRLRE